MKNQTLPPQCDPQEARALLWGRLIAAPTLTTEEDRMWHWRETKADRRTVGNEHWRSQPGGVLPGDRPAATPSQQATFDRLWHEQRVKPLRRIGASLCWAATVTLFLCDQFDASPAFWAVCVWAVGALVLVGLPLVLWSDDK